MLSSLYLIVMVAPLLCTMLVVNIVLEVLEVFPIVLDVPDVASSCHLTMLSI